MVRIDDWGREHGRSGHSALSWPCRLRPKSAILTASGGSRKRPFVGHSATSAWVGERKSATLLEADVRLPTEAVRETDCGLSALPTTPIDSAPSMSQRRHTNLEYPPGRLYVGTSIPNVDASPARSNRLNQTMYAKASTALIHIGLIWSDNLGSRRRWTATYLVRDAN